MARWGRLAQRAIAGDLAAFALLGLNTAERLSATAGVLAAIAAKRHAARPAQFLAELQELTRPAGFVLSRTSEAEGGRLRSQPIAAALRLLVDGFDRLALRLAEAGADAAGAAAIEKVLLARLLAAHRPHLVRLCLLAAAAGLARPEYRPGDLVPFIAPGGEADPSGAAAAQEPERARHRSG
ncbi:MAG: hypothetical protein JO010_04230 [Alphaproteobacteria bacterium]|nr:hypothetical protein [Alphaproteobacteria bacterium]